MIIIYICVTLVGGTLLGMIFDIAFVGNMPRNPSAPIIGLIMGYAVAALSCWIVPVLLKTFEKQSETRQEQKFKAETRVYVSNYVAEVERRESDERRELNAAYAKKVYDLYLYIQKVCEQVDDYLKKSDVFMKERKKYLDWIEVLKKVVKYDEDAEAVFALFEKDFHAFRQKAALLPTPVTDQDHALQLFGAMFSQFPVSRSPHLGKLAAVCNERVRAALPLPPPEQKPFLPKKPAEGTEPEFPKVNYSLEWIEETWGSPREWVKVHGKYQPPPPYDKNIPSGPNDPKIRSLKVFEQLSEYQPWRLDHWF